MGNELGSIASGSTGSAGSVGSAGSGGSVGSTVSTVSTVSTGSTGSTGSSIHPSNNGNGDNNDNINSTRTIPVSVQSNTKYGKWKDAVDCNCSASRRQVLEMRIVRTPLLSTASDIGLSAVRLTANVVTIGYVEKWLGIHGIPLEHQAIECDVFCIDCMRELIYTFEYLGGIGKLDRAGHCMINF